MNKFWKNWLRFWALGVVLFGVVLAGGAFAATDSAARLIFDILGNPFPATPESHLRFSIGLMGAVTIGWGVTYHGIFNAISTLSPTAAAPFWRAVLSATLGWYVIDGFISVATGFAMNVIPNTLLLVLLLVALFRSGALGGEASA